VDLDTSDYLSFFSSIPNLSLPSLLAIFLLGLMRLAPIVTIAPFLGARLPGSAKIGFTMILTIILLPHLITTVTHPISFNVYFIAYCLKELLMGMLMAVLISIPFYFAESAGILIDFMRGSSSLQVNDPTMQAQASPIGLLYNYVLIVLFFQIGGPFIFLQGVLQSYTVIPIDAFLSPNLFHFSLPFWKTLSGVLTQFAALAIQLAAPSIVAILMAEVFLGVANRLAPQVQIAFLGMSIKSLLGLALLWAGWFFILQQLGKQSLLWLQELDKIIRLMHV
jgi:type III secretion protein T